jgi:hypothetical protein
VWLSRWFFDGSLTKAAVIGVVLLFVLITVFSVIRSSLTKSPALLLTSALLITLLVSPYLYNYDFILLLVPFAVLVNKSSVIYKTIVVICYLVPTIAIAFYGRDGNISLLMVTIVIACLLYLRAKSKVDVPALAAYNTNN